MYPIKLKKLSGNEDIPIPQKMSSFASGYDIFAAVNEPITVQIGKRVLIPTGFALEMPPRIEAQVRPRSGLALKNGISLLNTPGTIDSDYRGEVKVILINLGEEDFVVKRGDRIAQLVFMELPEVQILEVDDIANTDRGEGGFGYTGK